MFAVVRGRTGCAIVAADARRESSAREENVPLSDSLVCMTVRGHVARGNGTTLNFKHNFSFASFNAVCLEVESECIKLTA